MKLKEKISIDDLLGKNHNKKVDEATEYGKAAFSHYLINHKNGISSFLKNEAIKHVKHAMEYKYLDLKINFAEVSFLELNKDKINKITQYWIDVLNILHLFFIVSVVIKHNQTN